MAGGAKRQKPMPHGGMAPGTATHAWRPARPVVYMRRHSAPRKSRAFLRSFSGVTSDEDGVFLRNGKTAPSATARNATFQRLRPR